MSETRARLQEIINSYIERDGSQYVDTGIVAAHIAQMKLFGIRQGVEFFPSQDNFGAQRKDFIDKVAKYNKLDTRLDSIWDYFLCDGTGLFYIRPTENNYRLYYFRSHEYRSYYNVDGELEEVVIIYSYKVKQGKNSMYQDIGLGGIDTPSALAQVSGGYKQDSQGQKRYIRLSIKPDVIEETHSEGEMTFDNISATMPGKTKTFPNTLRYIPCVEIFNNPKGFTMDGSGEFDQLANHIVTHDDLVRNMKKNLQFFGNPTLLSSRPKTDLMEPGNDGVPQRPSIAANSGFQSMSPLSRSTFKQDPITRGVDGQMRVPRVIANLEPNDRVGYIVPDAISGDQNAFVRQFREEIRTALGGVDELSISAGVTATEYKSLYGRVAATSKKKANSIYEHGICRCMELIIYQEEQLFKDTLAAAAKFEKPIPPAPGAPPEEEEMYKQAIMEYEERIKGLIAACVRAQMIPPGVRGLIPDGDITMLWRWLGPVYEESTQDILNNSIVVRNLQELGVDSIEALKYLFPSKTDEERAEMLSGFPFRMVNELQGAYNQFAKLIAGMMQTPHPQSPDLPMAADPRLDLTPYLYRTLECMQKEMSYAGRFRPIDPTDEPPVRGPEQLRGGSTGSSGPGSSSGGSDSASGNLLPPGGAPGPIGAEYQLPIKPVTIRPPIPGLSGEPMGIGVQQGGESTGEPGAIPVPGSTVTGPGSGSESIYPGQLGYSGQSQPGSNLGAAAIGSADLYNKPDLIQQLFPNFLNQLIRGRSESAGLESGESDGSGKLRNRGSSDSKSVRSKPRRNAR